MGANLCHCPWNYTTGHTIGLLNIHLQNVFIPRFVQCLCSLYDTVTPMFSHGWEGSAAGGGGDGTVQEGEWPGRGVHGDGDGEVKDSAALADGWAASLGGATGGGQDLGLKLQQLSHEAKVGGDDAAPLLDKLEGLVQLHTVGAHEVG